AMTEDQTEMFTDQLTKPAKNGRIHPDTLRLVEHTWNEFATAHGLPTIVGLNDKRKTSLRARLKDPVWRERWQEALAQIPRRPFCMGQNDRGWKANFDWFLRPNTVVSLLEGSKYVNQRE